MKIYQNIHDYIPNRPLIITLGMYDGIHLGHQEILKNVQQIAKEQAGTAALLTYNPHPRLVLNNTDEPFKLLNTLEEKLEKLEKLGLEILFNQTFDQTFANIDAISFVEDYLIQKLKVHTIIMGYDHQFGKNRTGNYKLLQKYAANGYFKLYKIAEKCFLEQTISSSKIRNALLSSHLNLANQMLGEPYVLMGNVIKGDQIGRKLGFPTANIQIPTEKLIPHSGVYIVEVNHSGDIYYGLMNIGFRPTIAGARPQTEVYIFNFSKNIYGSFIRVKLLHFLRNEQRFSNLETLQIQIQHDVQIAQKWIQESLKI